MNVLTALKDRIWIPYQVALEFQINRLTVISQERSNIEKALSEINEVHDKTINSINSLQMEKRGLSLDSGELLKAFSKAKDDLIGLIAAAREAQLDISADDPIRDQIDELLVDSVGPPPLSQEDLDRLTSDGDTRYRDNIPPGYKDEGKSRFGEAVYFFDGMRYERKFGDLIIWRQIIDYVTSSGVKDVLFVTSDQKDDWWWNEKGRTIGPRPELSREIKAKGNVELFWMYKTDTFLKMASTFTKTSVSPDSVSQVEEIQRLSKNLDWVIPSKRRSFRSIEEELPRISRSSSSIVDRPYEDPHHFSFFKRRAVSIAAKWYLQNRFGFVDETNGFPDFCVTTSGKKIGYDTRIFHDFCSLTPTSSMRDAMLRGYVEVREGRLDQFWLLAFVEQDEYLTAREKFSISQITDQLRIGMQLLSCDGIRILTIDETGMVRALLTIRSRE